MRKSLVLLIVFALLSSMFVTLFAGSLAGATDGVVQRSYPNQSVKGTYYPDPYGLFWDLTGGDLTVSYTVDMSAYKPSSQPSASSQVGLNNTWGPVGWMDTRANNLAQFPKEFDKNDQVVLNANTGANDAASYTATGPDTYVWPSWDPNLNYGIYFDRGAADPTKLWGLLNTKNFNTGGKYNVVIKYHAMDSMNGSMFATVNGVQQGFWAANSDMKSAPQFIPVGKTFWADQTQLLLTETICADGVSITNFKAEGSPAPPTMAAIYPISACQGQIMNNMKANGSQFRNVPATLELENPATKELPVKASKVTWLSDMLINAKMTIRDDASAGKWDVAYWHNDDTTKVARMPGAFEIVNAPPTITSVTPDHSVTNQKISMTINGNYFRNVPMSVELRRGADTVSGKISQYVSRKQLKAEFIIPTGTALADDWVVYLWHDDEPEKIGLFLNFSVDARIDIINPFGVFNWIWLRAPGILEVVMYSEQNFDATTIVPLAVDLGGTFPIATNPQDVNHDGKIDQIFYFNNMAVKLPLGINNVRMLAADGSFKRIEAWDTVKVFWWLF
jgi:hypothetical protein